VTVLASWLDTIADQPLESVLSAVILVAGTVAGAFLLRRLTQRVRSLRNQVLAVTLTALATGAVAAVLLARLMILDSGELARVTGVLALTAVFATILVLVASAPLGRDVRRLEDTVRRIEAGDRQVRTAVHRADELGHVARALDELTARLDRLERERAGYETERTAMLSNIGHDLRTPLAALRAAVEALTDGVAPDPDRYLRAMRRDVEALSALVDDFFLLARIEAGRLEVRPAPVDLTEVADEAVEALAPVAAASGVRVALEATQRLHVRGNATAIGRVIRNLIDNAIRHAPPGSEVRVTVGAGGTPSVHVVDEGPGFPEDFSDLAFGRFTRADASRTRATGGAGLGLAIARGLVEAHGGRIWIEEAPGGRVAFELPAA
jgi:signal transduction histidine kinase